MRSLRAWMTRIAATVMGRRRDREFNQELHQNIQLHVDDNVRSGMPPDIARRAALRSIGGVQSTLERHRDARGLPLLDCLAQDLRYGVRTLLRNPGFAAAAI